MNKRGDTKFPISSNTQDPLETAIAQQLWRWKALPVPERGGATSQLPAQLEFYSCGVFRTARWRAPGWWCDGVLALTIEGLGQTTFRLIGAAVWGQSSPIYLAPFEVEMHFSHFNAQIPLRTYVRFGALDKHDQILKTPLSADARRIAAYRPQRNADWALAVEVI